MNKEVLRVLEYAEKMKWITINEHMDREALCRAMIDTFYKDMTVRNYIEHFYPRDI